MNQERIRRIRSPAIGATIAGLRYEPDAGYVVIELDSSEKLWVQADAEGYHVFATSNLDDVSERRPQITTPCIAINLAGCNTRRRSAALAFRCKYRHVPQ